MHRHPASRPCAILAVAAIAFGGAFVPERAASGFTLIATAHAAEPPARATPRPKKARAARDTPFGREGDPKKATRTIRIEMSDTMRYFPEHVTVKKGQTVRFNLKNSGGLPHEMVLGTMDDLKKHAAITRRSPPADHHHEDANVAHVEPGQSGRIVWQFTRAGEFYFGCLVPGHFEAGMIGTIVVR
jgi:uncharacterized cupredoxin-like copper-binding protein